MSQQALRDLEKECGPGYATQSSIELVLDHSGTKINLDIDKLLSNDRFKQIESCIGEITSLEIMTIHAGRFKDLDKLFQHFPEGMAKLRKLEISFQIQDGTCTPPSGDSKSFGDFGGSLKSLFLYYVPLQLFNDVTTLTDFTLSDLGLAHSLDYLLDFLGINPLLQEVKLRIGFEDPNHTCSKAKDSINLKELKLLRVECSSSKYIKDLISCMVFPGGATREIFTWGPEGLEEWSECCNHKATSSHMVQGKSLGLCTPTPYLL